MHSIAYYKTNVIPKRREDVVRRREAQCTCSLHRSKFYTFLMNKCNLFFCETTLTLGWSCRATFSLAVRLPGVFLVASRVPKSSKLVRHLHTNTTCLICNEGDDVYMNIDQKREPIADKYVKDFGVNKDCTLFSDESAKKDK